MYVRAYIYIYIFSFHFEIMFIYLEKKCNTSIFFLTIFDRIDLIFEKYLDYSVKILSRKLIFYINLKIVCMFYGYIFYSYNRMYISTKNYKILELYNFRIIKRKLV